MRRCNINFFTIKFTFMKDKIFFLSFSFAMQSCNVCDATNPAADFPTFVAGLNADMSVQRGGISTFLFAKCEAVFSDYTLTELQDAIDAEELIVLKGCEVTGSKTTEATTATVGSCKTDVVTSRKHTVTITDIIDNASYDRALWWIHTNSNPNDYKLAYITCDGKLYPFNNVSINANNETQDTTDGYDQYNVIATYDKLVQDMPIPIAWSPDDLVY